MKYLSQKIVLKSRRQEVQNGRLVVYLVGATNLYSRPSNIVGLSIVLWSPTSH